MRRKLLTSARASLSSLAPPFPPSKKIIPPRNPPFLHHLDCTTPYTWFSPLLRDPRRLFVVVVVIVVAVVVASKWYKMCEMSHSLSFSLSVSLSLSLSLSLSHMHIIYLFLFPIFIFPMHTEMDRGPKHGERNRRNCIYEHDFGWKFEQGGRCPPSPQRLYSAAVRFDRRKTYHMEWRSPR